LRQDPQVIMIGEIRDADTAMIAVQASLTGHLVISTIHAGSTTGVYTRLLNMGIEPYLLCSSVIGVLGLRLVRRNCSFCAAPYEPETNLVERLPQEILEQADFRRGLGCTHCDFSGYEGRKGIVEMLVPTQEIRDAVMAKKPESEMQRIAIDSGMETLWEHGIRRVLAGESTYEDIMSAVVDEGY